MRLSELVEGIPGKLEADGVFDTLGYCTSPLQVPFLSFMENAKFLNRMSRYVTCVLCSEDLRESFAGSELGLFVTAQPKKVFQMIHNKLARENDFYRLPQYRSVTGEGCVIAPSAVIAAENVRIGKNCLIEENVVIREQTRIGDNCILHSGCVIGGKGFTYARGNDGSLLGMEDAGEVVIGNDVEIMSMTHIARGTLPTDSTVIGDGTKIDALVHIGHGVKVGAHSMIAATALIGGNTEIGEKVWIGVNATVSNRIRIGDGARVSLGAVVTKDVSSGVTVTGNFAIEHQQFIDHLKQSLL